MTPHPRPTPNNGSGPTPAELLAKMPRRPMTPEQQAAALEKVQQQASQRVKLGQQLFQAAENRLKQHQQVLKEIQDQQQILRDKVQEDVARSLQTYDQWMGQIDESFTKAIADLNMRLDVLETRFDSSRDEMEAMIDKAAGLLSQTQGLLAEAFGDEPGEQVATEMQAAVPAGSDVDIDAIEDLVMPPVVDEDTSYGDDTEVIEIEIVEPREDAVSETPADAIPMDAEGTREADDVFGEVLRRLRSQSDEDHDAAA